MRGTSKKNLAPHFRHQLKRTLLVALAVDNRTTRK